MEPSYNNSQPKLWICSNVPLTLISSTAFLPYITDNIESGYIVYVYNYISSLQSPLLPQLYNKYSTGFDLITSLTPFLVEAIKFIL